MEEIGVRALKATLSDVLRRVAQGHRIRVTAHGRPVADIVPPSAPGTDDLLQALVDDGRLSPARSRRPARAPRLALPELSASELVLSDREAER